MGLPPHRPNPARPRRLPRRRIPCIYSTGRPPQRPAAPQAPALDPLHLFDAGGSRPLRPGGGTRRSGHGPAAHRAAQGLREPTDPSDEGKTDQGEEAFGPGEGAGTFGREGKVPVWVLGAAAAALVVGLVCFVVLYLQKPAYQLADQVVALRPTRAEVREVVEMDHHGVHRHRGEGATVGFAPLTRWRSGDPGAELLLGVHESPEQDLRLILKLPGVITPKLSFVNTMTTGTWLSTNGWETQSPAMDKLDSESAPNDDPNALWARHQRHLEGATQAGQNPSLTSEWRFVSALCDHLRWYMDMKGIPATSRLRGLVLGRAWERPVQRLRHALGFGSWGRRSPDRLWFTSTT
jgi:hypothetical protein